MSNSETVPVGSLIGIDIGMTCTGVAICVYSEGETRGPIVVQKWPGSRENASKVPTRVAYKAGKAAYHSWGFKCPELEEVGPAMAVKEMFKFHLDKWFLKEDHQRGQDGGFELEDVKLWYKDYLSALYSHIVQCLREKWKVDVGLTTVEYIFSIPTLWSKEDQLVQTFRELVEATGFGDGYVIMNLTEAEASAVSTAKLLDHGFQEGDAFIVCDAGGATTDMCALQVTQVDGDAVQLKPLDDPKVIPVGSLDIDDLFEAKAAKRINELRSDHSDSSKALAHQIMRRTFQDIKVECGTGAVNELDVTLFQIPGTNEQIKLSPSELESMFDIQIQKMLNLIDHQIAYLKEDCPEVNLSTLFLAGGLGSSKYLQDEMIKYYKDIKVMFAPDPEDLPLSVCKGLVIDRLQHFSDHASVISIRSTSASYGILCREVYNKRRHSGQPFVKDQLDGIKYADNQIDWIVVRGQNPAQEDTVIRRYSRVVSPENPPESWGFAVVRSQAKPDKLRTFIEGHRGPRIICHAMSDGEAGSNRAPIIHRRELMTKKYRFCRIDYELSATVGLGKMKFQIKIFGQADSKRETLKVAWQQDDEFSEYGERCALIKTM
ncbi:uncharacterized protein PAC_15359 [Phialocephala subalpina]|uniref:Hsp70 protein n=1 Tax=Phialocephala subalpina TaxID=576137 RepID=A0A1L7XK84_9HELO|nr:uncharacterized protein PAC_15359 [Phialocephala subalpina]